MNNFKWRTPFAEATFRNKYANSPEDTWPNLCRRLVNDVCGDRSECSQPNVTPLMSAEDQKELVQIMIKQQFISGGRYLYYGGRPVSFFNNCFCLKAEEDSREEWGRLLQRASDCLMSGGGIGVDYSILRPSGRTLRRTGGISSGPIPLMCSINEVGRNVMQGGSRRSAIYASLNWQHEDIESFLVAKEYSDEVKAMKAKDFNAPAQLDMTNISINLDTEFINRVHNGDVPDLWYRSVLAMCRSGEPGHSYNFYENENETLRNAPLGPETYVLTKQGYRQIQEMVDEEVEVWTGKQWASTTFKKTGDMVPVVTVKMSGGRVILAEPSHEFILEDGSRIPAANLKRNDRLAIGVRSPTKLGLGVTAVLPTERDADYYTLGFIYGDGSFSKKYNRAEFAICTPDKEVCLSGMNRSLFSSVNERDVRGFVRGYTKTSELFADCHKAVYPERLYAASVSKQASFLAGLFDADGSYDAGRGMIRLASMHITFLEGVRRQLEQFGIYSGISTAGKSSYSGRQGYLLTIYSTYHDEFGRLIPTLRMKPASFVPYRKSKIRVVSVEDAGFSDVFCCDVKVEEHSFVAEGVLVSNCTEFTSEDDSDVCNLGSVNMGNIETIEEFADVVTLAAKFLVCGSLRGDLPYEKVRLVREKNRKIGLGLMGIHEWLLRRGYNYEVVPELHKWLEVYKTASEKAANEHSDRFFINRPKKYRAIAPAGTIGILAATTTGIEPLFATAYKRRYLMQGTKWKYQYVIDATAQRLIDEYGLKPEEIETSYSMAGTPEKRIQFQYEIQKYVDMSISSTINLPAWGTELNNEDTARSLADTLLMYCGGLRGITVYPDGGRGGQPLTEVPYEEARKHIGVVFDENEERCSGGVCGI